MRTQTSIKQMTRGTLSPGLGRLSEKSWTHGAQKPLREDGFELLEA